MTSKILLSCVCQSGPIAAALQEMFPHHAIDAMMQPGHDDDAGVRGLLDRLRDADLWIRYMDYVPLMAREDVRSQVAGLPTIEIPIVNFRAFHPDLHHVLSAASGRPISPVYHSGIVVWAWRNRVPLAAVKPLFNRATFQGLGYLDAWADSVENLRSHFTACGLDFSRFFLRTKRMGAFMYMPIHPKIEAIVNFAKVIALKMGADPAIMEQPIAINDMFASLFTWPVYPEIGDHYALPSSYTWTIDGRTHDLDGFIALAYRHFAAEATGPEDVIVMNHGPAWDERYDSVLRGQVRSVS